jgi:hypothetical protein
MINKVVRRVKVNVNIKMKKWYLASLVERGDWLRRVPGYLKHESRTNE